MALQAVAMSFSRPVKSPLAPATWRCSSMMNWVRVVRPSIMSCVPPVAVRFGFPPLAKNPAGAGGEIRRHDCQRGVEKADPFPRSDKGNLAAATYKRQSLFLLS